MLMLSNANPLNTHVRNAHTSPEHNLCAARCSTRQPEWSAMSVAATVRSLRVLPCSLLRPDSIDRLETAQRRGLTQGEPVTENTWDRHRHMRAAAAAHAGVARPCDLCSATGTRPFCHLIQLRSLTVQVRVLDPVA